MYQVRLYLSAVNTLTATRDDDDDDDDVSAAVVAGTTVAVVAVCSLLLLVVVIVVSLYVRSLRMKQTHLKVPVDE